MNKRERILAAFGGQETDYVPGCFWRHYTPEINRGEDVIEAHLKFYRDTDVDFVKISCDGYFGWPAEVLQDLRDPSQLYQMERVELDSPFMREQIERAKEIVKRLDGECCTFYTLFCPLSIFRLQVGWDKMMEFIRKDPEAVAYACNRIAEDENRLMEALIREAGVDGIFYSVQNAEITRFTLEEYQKLVEPSDRKVLDFANSLSDYNILHCCGWDADAEGTVNHLESWQDYPAGAISWASYVDRKNTKEIRDFFGGKPAWGGFDNRTCGLLYTGTEEEIKAETERLIEEGGFSGFLLGPDCSLPDDIDAQRIRWIMEATKAKRKKQ